MALPCSPSPHLSPSIPPQTHKSVALLLGGGEGGDRLEVLPAATEPLTLRPAVHFPAAITAACLTSDHSGWLAANAHTLTGAL